MIIRTSTHRRDSRRYKAVLRRIKGLGSLPKFITVIRVNVPEPRQFSLQTLAGVEQHLTQFIAGQRCLQFGVIKSAAQFWHEDGRLSGEAAVHLYAHLLLTIIYSQRRQLLVVHKNDGRKTVRTQERVYRPNMREKRILNVVLTGQYHRKPFDSNIHRLSEALGGILAKGVAVQESIGNNQSL